MAVQLAFASTLAKSLLGCRTQDGDYVLLDGDSLIGAAFGQDPSHYLWTDHAVDLTTTGVAASLEWSYVMPVEVTFAADVVAAVPVRITTSTPASPTGTGRLNLVVSKNGTPLVTQNGPTSAMFAQDAGVASNPANLVVLHAVMPETDLCRGDTIDFKVEVEVVASGGTSATLRHFHDPSGGGGAIDARQTFEVNV